MAEISLYSEPGSERANEDWAGCSANAAVVLDGLSSPKDLPTGCAHDVPWYVSQLGPALLDGLADSARHLPDVLATAIERVAARHASSCDLSSPGTPSSTVAMVRWGESTVEWLVLADAAILIRTSAGVEVFTDTRVEDAVRDQQREARAHPLTSPLHGQAVTKLVEQQRKVRNTPGGYWVAAADPEAARWAASGSQARAQVTDIALVSDGAAQKVEFGLTDWVGLMAELLNEGPKQVIEHVRQLEASDPEGTRWPRYKNSDDATAVVISRG